jgi:hypothetical protein
MKFRSPTNPSLDDLRAWGYDSEATQPIPDWDLVLTWTMERARFALCLELASDPNCPKWRFFLDLLYFVFEYGSRHGGIRDRPWQYQSFLELARGIDDPHVKHWRHRAGLLFGRPESFDASQWNFDRDPFAPDERELDA